MVLVLPAVGQQCLGGYGGTSSVGGAGRHSTSTFSRDASSSSRNEPLPPSCQLCLHATALLHGKQAQASVADKNCLQHAGGPCAPATRVQRSGLGGCVPADVAVTRACQVRYMRERNGCWGSRKPRDQLLGAHSVDQRGGLRNGGRQGLSTKWFVQACSVYRGSCMSCVPLVAEGGGCG